MDSLDNLPTNENITPTPDEVEVMAKYFPVTRSNSASDDEVQPKKTTSGTKSCFSWKIIGFLVLAFALLACSMPDILLGKIPYMSSSIAVYGVKVAIFFVFTVTLLYFSK